MIKVTPETKVVESCFAVWAAKQPYRTLESSVAGERRPWRAWKQLRHEGEVRAERSSCLMKRAPAAKHKNKKQKNKIEQFKEKREGGMCNEVRS